MLYINARFLTQRITGVQRFAIEISKRLMKKYPNIKFIAPNNIVHADLAKELDVVKIGKRRGHLWEQIDLPKFLKKEGSPLLINFCNTGPALYSNTIVTVHDLAFLENPSWFNKTFYLYYKNLVPFIIKRATLVLTVSEFSKKEIVNKLKVIPSKVRVINNGVDKEFVSDTKGVYSKYVLYVGSLDPRKNMYRLLKAAKHLPSDYKLIVVGGTAKSFAEEDHQQLSNKIDFVGYVSDERLVELYNKACAFVYPSQYEGFGIPPLEAQAIGVPIVISDIPVFREIFNCSAIYFDPYSVVSIGEGLTKAINLSDEQRTLLIEKGKINVSRFSWDKSTDKLLEMLNVNNHI